jgi:5-oxoprolinase (ATP-hydrolysing) subunit A
VTQGIYTRLVALFNLDAGEYPDEPEELWGLCDVVCVACGGHAGDRASMERVIAFCAASGRPRLGAHPSYPDREGFGRRPWPIAPAELAATIREQCAALDEIARAHGVRVEWVKPHGALYHDAAANPLIAGAVVRGVAAALDAPSVIGPPRGALRDAALAHGLRYAREGFADRATRSDGTLVPRSEPGALITDPAACARRAIAIAGEVDTVCVHADTPGAVAIAHAVRAALAS